MNNIHRAGRPKKRLDDDMCKILLTMYETKTTRQIAEEFHVSQPTICAWLRKAKIQLSENIDGRKEREITETESI